MKKSDLLTAIKAVMIGVEKGSSATGMDFVLFDENWIRSFKDDISVSFPLTTGLRTAVRAEELFKVVSKMKGEELDIKIGEGKLLVKDNKTTLKMNPLQSDNLNHSLERILSVQTDDLDWYQLPKGFIEGLRLCVFSAGTGPALNTLAGVHFASEKVISTDNFRVSVYGMEEMVPFPFTIPTKSAEGLLKLGIDFDSIAISKAWMHLSDKGGAIFSSRLLSGEYPADKILGLFTTQKFSSEKAAYKLPEGLEESLDRAEVLAGVDDATGFTSIVQVSLSYSNGNLIVKAGKEVGEIVDEIPWEKDSVGEGFEMKVQPDFLRKVLRLTREFKISPTKKSILFSSEKFQHIMVAHISGKEK